MIHRDRPHEQLRPRRGWNQEDRRQNKEASFQHQRRYEFLEHSMIPSFA